MIYRELKYRWWVIGIIEGCHYREWKYREFGGVYREWKYSEIPACLTTSLKWSDEGIGFGM